MSEVIRCGRGWLPPKPLGEEPSCLSSSWGFRGSLACGCVPPVSASLFTWLSPLPSVRSPPSYLVSVCQEWAQTWAGKPCSSHRKSIRSFHLVQWLEGRAGIPVAFFSPVGSWTAMTSQVG